MEGEDQVQHDGQSVKSDASPRRQDFLRRFAIASATVAVLGVLAGCDSPAVYDPGPVAVYGPRPVATSTPEPTPTPTPTETPPAE